MSTTHRRSENECNKQNKQIHELLKTQAQTLLWQGESHLTAVWAKSHRTTNINGDLATDALGSTTKQRRGQDAVLPFPLLLFTVNLEIPIIVLAKGA